MVRRLQFTCLVGLLALAGCGLSSGGAAAEKVVPAPHPAYATDATWTSANKDGFGTAYTYGNATWPKRSRVWFTLLNGGFSEIYYPTYDTVAVNRLRFLVSNGRWLDDEESDLSVDARFLAHPTLAYRVISTSRKHGYRIEKSVVADPARDSLVMQVRFVSTSSASKGAHLYLHLEPALGNTSAGNNASVSQGGLDAWIGGAAMALRTSAPVSAATVGFLRNTDGLTQLASKHRLVHRYTIAKKGHVAGTLELNPGTKTFTVALGFGRTRARAENAARATLNTRFSATAQAYITGWRRYCAGLSGLKGIASDRAYVSAMTVKAAEDKTYPGAIVASPTHPWGDQAPDTSDQHGYVRVWPRDLYHAAMGLLAAGDRTTALEALDWLAKAQHPDGSEPQNAFVTGQPSWTGVQMDEVSVPILLAWRLGATKYFHTTVRRAARYIVQNGPVTSQERWEETSGYSPATMASEIAALTAAADMAKKAGDASEASSWQATADRWQRALDGQTYTTNGPLGGHAYYPRITNGRPNDSITISLANNGGTYDQRSIVDPSFLELVRLGVKSPNDPHILSTIPVVDSVLETQTPRGPGWHRYNHDGYGDSKVPFGPGQGHIWPVFDGERGMYDVAAGKPDAARSMLHTMERMSGPTYLVPEQAWESTGEGTHSATPLVWAQAEYVVLLRSIHDGTPFDRPTVAADRYAR